MKTNTLLLASAAGLLGTASVLLSDPAAPAAPAQVESRHLAVVAGPAEASDAETRYAEAANNSATRLALLKLDREREARLEQALALTDETAKTQAVAELDAWYDTSIGGIFIPAEP